MNVAIITGASSGMGKDFVLELDSRFEFDEMWLIARRLDKLEALEKELKNKARIISLDLEKKEDLEKYTELLNDVKPNVKFLVNSAGFGRFGNYQEVDCAVSLKMIDLNCKTLVYMTMNTLPYMNSGARIINLGSASSFFPLINLNVYASTKAFVVHYSNALHDELKNRKISVTVVCPGWVKTEFFDVAKNTSDVHGPKQYKPMLESKKVVKKAVNAAMKGKKFCVYNWYTKFHRFGARFFPRWFMLSTWKGMQKKEVTKN